MPRLRISTSDRHQEDDSGRSERLRALRRNRHQILKEQEAYQLSRTIKQPVLPEAVNVFLSDTVVKVPHDSLSRGYFSSLVALVDSSSRSDALPFALEAVALASFAGRFFDPSVQNEATRRYASSIYRLRNTALDAESNLSSILASIMLLSIYEIITANRDNSLNCLQHLHGLIAVMRNIFERYQLPAAGVPMLIVGLDSTLSLYDFLLDGLHSRPVATEANLGRPDSDTGKSKPSGLCAILEQPALPSITQLCSILPRVQILFRKSATLFDPISIRYETNLQSIRDEAMALKVELTNWSTAQPDSVRPRTVERFTQHFTLQFPQTADLVCPTTHADTYSDFYVASMWGSYRQCHLHLTDLLNRIDRSLSKDPEKFSRSRGHTKACAEIQTLVSDICASIPFMLIGERIQGHRPVGSVWRQNRPPLLSGGLNLQWVLFTISIIEMVPVSMKTEMKTCLRWIGQSLGIGQASMLANMDRNLPGGITAKGDALKWAGFLI